jgi:hypothetical protein
MSSTLPQLELNMKKLSSTPGISIPASSQYNKLQSIKLQSIVKKCAAVLFSADRTQQASKFCEIAAFAKRTTGNCWGLIDSVARYRKKLWKSTEGHRQFLRLKQHSPPLLSYISSVYQKPPSSPYILYI